MKMNVLCFVLVWVCIGAHRIKKLFKDRCGECDHRACVYISPATCQGVIMKDKCNCCPVCDTANTLQVATEKKHPAILPNDTASVAKICAVRKCKKSEVCVINIQGIAVCKCPSLYWCRKHEPRNVLCGQDGRTYKSRCYIKHEQCLAKKKIRVVHRGACRAKLSQPAMKVQVSFPKRKLKPRKYKNNKSRKKQMRRVARRKARVQKLKAKIRFLKSKKKDKKKRRKGSKGRMFERDT